MTDARTLRWESGQPIVRREVWKGRPWMGIAAIVVEDVPDHLAVFVPTHAPFGYAAGNWPTEDGRHPWELTKTRWEGHGCLMVQSPGEPYAIWHFWSGPSRTFDGWYVNLQDPFRRTPGTLDTLDHEVDVVVAPDGTPTLKDVDRIDHCVRHGRFDAAFADQVVTRGDELVRRLREPAGIWWDRRWADWEPPAGWVAPSALPSGWDR